MREYNFEEERMPLDDFDYRDEYPTEEMLINWREENDYVNESTDYREGFADDENDGETFDT